MHYIPHQRSLPPIPTTSSHLAATAWQRSSLPARSRPRSPPAQSWQRSSFPAQPRRRPVSSHYDTLSTSSKDLYNHLSPRPRSPPRFYHHPRSTSTHNLYDVSPFDPYTRPISDRYSTDDLTPLHSRHYSQSLDRRYTSKRSTTHFEDLPEYPDRYEPRRPIRSEMRHHHRRPYMSGSDRYSSRRHDEEDHLDHHTHRYDVIEPPYTSPYDLHRNLSRSSNSVHRSYSNVSPSFLSQREYTPRTHSKHSSPEDARSNVSVAASMRSKASSHRRESPYERSSLCSRASMRKELICNEAHNYRENNELHQSSTPQETKFVYLKQPTPQHCTQVLATLVVSLGPLCAGLGKGYSSPALPSMEMGSAQGHHFPISSEQGSWVASLSLLGAFFGSLPAGMSINWGRKRVLCVVAIPFALSWILTVVAMNVYMLYIAAILGGVCTAIISVVTPVYISEIAHPEIRGCLCAFSKLNSNVGMLFSYLLGAFLNWRQLATVTAIAPACLFLCSLLIPETPSFLLYKGRDAEATESLKWLRGSSADISRELTIMKANIATMRRQQQQDPSGHSAPREIFRPLFITCGLMVFQKFSGANAFNFYAVAILKETFVGLNPYRAAIVVAFVQICAGMASSALVDTVGRRPLLVFSNMLMAAALAAFGCYVYLKGLHHQNGDMASRQEWRESDWVPLFCILVIEIAYALGVSPISWLYIGELFPLKHRGFGALAASVSYVCSFASVKTFVDLQTWLGLYGAFWFYASVATLALAFTLIFVPETKGKSLQEMQVMEQQKETLI